MLLIFLLATYFGHVEMNFISYISTKTCNTIKLECVIVVMFNENLAVPNYIPLKHTYFKQVDIRISLSKNQVFVCYNTVMPQESHMVRSSSLRKPSYIHKLIFVAYANYLHFYQEY